MISASRPLWFGHGEEEILFYPFGIRRTGYRVPPRQVESFERWTRLRAQLPLALTAFGFPPVVALWGPSWSASGRLTAQTLALALALLLVLVAMGGWLIDRLAFALLLRGCVTLDRRPTRSEQQASAGRVGQSFANLNAAPLAARWSCLAVGFVTIMLGLHGGDVWLGLSGLLPVALFALDVTRDSCQRIHLWLLFDAVAVEREES